MKLHQLQYVVKVAQYRNFSKAAKALFISQPSLSQQILKLEQELDVNIFVRRPNSITLTPKGEMFVKEAEEILQKIDSMMRQMAKHHSQDHGSIKIGVSWIWGYVGINTHLDHFQEKYPGIDLILDPAGTVTLLKLLEERRYDCVFVSPTAEYIETHKELFFHKLVRDHYTCIIPNGHRLADKKSISINDLKNEMLILPGEDSTTRERILKAFREYNIAPVIAFTSSQFNINVQMVCSGKGLCFLSSVVAKACANGQFKSIPIDPPIERAFYYTTQSNSDNPLIPLLTSFVKDNFVSAADVNK